MNKKEKTENTKEIISFLKSLKCSRNSIGFEEFHEALKKRISELKKMSEEEKLREALLQIKKTIIQFELKDFKSNNIDLIKRQDNVLWTIGEIKIIIESVLN